VHEYTTDKGWNSTKNKGKSSYFFTIYAGSGSVDFSGVSNDCGSRFFGVIENMLFFMHSWSEPTASAVGTLIHLKPFYNIV
jgi:hypothetical protein